jgi:hypothetical protein
MRFFVQATGKSSEVDNCVGVASSQQLETSSQ